MSALRTDDAVEADPADPADPGRSRSRRRRKHKSWARRRHLGLITTLLAIAVLAGGVLTVVATWDSGRIPLSRQAAAATTGATGPAPTTGSTAPTSTASVSSAPGAITVRAVIAGIGDNQWTVTGSTGLTYTVVVTPATTLPRKRDFASFEVGTTISVKGSLADGTITADSVAVGR